MGPSFCILLRNDIERELLEDVIRGDTKPILITPDIDDEDAIDKLRELSPKTIFLPGVNRRNLKICRAVPSASIISIEYGSDIPPSLDIPENICFMAPNEISSKIIMENLDSGRYINAGHIRSLEHMKPKQLSERDFSSKYSLDIDKDTISYASSHPADLEGLIDEYNIIYTSPHIISKRDIEVLKHADLVVSDTFNGLMAAAFHGKRAIQLVHEGGDGRYRLPTIRGEPFYVGWLTTPSHLKETLCHIFHDIDSYDIEFSRGMQKAAEASGIGDPFAVEYLSKFIDNERETREILSPQRYREIMGYPDFYRKRGEEKVVITFGVFDMFHIGHFNILERASKLGDVLIAGVFSDAATLKKKGQVPMMTQNEREEMVSKMSFVSGTFIQNSLALKRHYILKYQADIVCLGSDRREEGEGYKDICEVVILDRTEGISSTDIKQRMRERLS